MTASNQDHSWLDKAACSGVGWEPFFDSSNLEPALSLCRTCTVRVDCLRFAVGAGLDSGVWGGLSAEGRRRVRSSQLVA